MPSSANIRSLTSIRGFAAWWVVLYHFRGLLFSWGNPQLIGFFARGYVAVDLFFELSGFVIALNYSSFFQSGRFAEMPHFLALRLARIYPLHLFVLCAMTINPLALLLTGHTVIPSRYSPTDFVLSVLLVQNWGFTDHLVWNGPAWSISTEWLAYLIFPVFVWMLAVVNQSRAKLLLSMAAILFLLGMAARMVGGLGNDIPHFGVVRCLFEFLLGMNLYYLTECTRRYNWLSLLCFIAGLAATGAFVAGWQPDYTVVPIGFLLIVYGLSDRSMMASRILWLRGFEAIGLISYSTYMVHSLVDDWVRFILVRPSVPDKIAFPAAILLTFVLSVVLYRGIEVPGRSWGRSVADRLFRLRLLGAR